MVSDDAGRGGRPGLRMASVTSLEGDATGQGTATWQRTIPGHDKGNGACLTT
jgi:hypothetical protein